MSTEHAHEHDHEYGPTPPGAKHEHTDIDVECRLQVRAVAGGGDADLGRASSTARSGSSKGEGQRRTRRAQEYPLAVGQRKEPPTPNLQNQPFKDIYTLRQGEAGRLAATGGSTRMAASRACRSIARWM